MFRHLHEIKEPYTKHAMRALRIWRQALIVVLVLPIHALWPDVFVQTASNCLRKIEIYRQNRRNENAL